MQVDVTATVEIITPEILKQALMRWQQVGMLPAELLDLRLLSAVAARSSVVKSIWLYDYFYEVVTGHLKRCREAVGIPHPDALPASCEAILARDFNARDGFLPPPELTAWSALFHRYFLPITIGVGELAGAAGISERHMRRQLQMGLALLARALRRAELQAWGMEMRESPVGT